MNLYIALPKLIWAGLIAGSTLVSDEEILANEAARQGVFFASSDLTLCCGGETLIIVLLRRCSKFIRWYELPPQPLAPQYFFVSAHLFASCCVCVGLASSLLLLVVVCVCVWSLVICDTVGWLHGDTVSWCWLVAWCTSLSFDRLVAS